MTTEGGNGQRPRCACLVGPTCSVELWGLSSQERLRRQLRVAGIVDWCDPAAVPDGRDAILLRGDYLFEDRTIADLVNNPGFVLCVADAAGREQAVAAHVPGVSAPVAHRYLDGEEDPRGGPFRVGDPASLSSAYVGKLLKATVPRVLPIRAERAAGLERRLFDGSYKGVTDLVTKWVWPRPARWFTGICARRGIRPNSVTLTSLILVLTALGAFALGGYAIGLVAAWVMTFLDTVDGKLARVTIDYSPFGHRFDHGIDLISPPLWYLAWGWGLPGQGLEALGLTLRGTFLVLLAAYVAGRLVEATFNALMNKFSIFTWRPVDSYFRLIMARRNPNLIFLTLSVVAGRPDLGLVMVTVWTVLSGLFLLVRLVMSLHWRMTKGPLRPWLSELDSTGEIPVLARPFVIVPQESGR